MVPVRATSTDSKHGLGVLLLLASGKAGHIPRGMKHHGPEKKLSFHSNADNNEVFGPWNKTPEGVPIYCFLFSKPNY
jgi:hypothetical protein